MKKIFLPLLGILFFLNCQTPPSADLHGHLIIIGGGKRPVEIMEKFVDLCGGDQANIAIIPNASGYPLEVGAEYEAEFLALGVKSARAFQISSDTLANSDSILNQLKKFSGIFFCGGDQNRLTKIFNGTKCLNYFHAFYKKGGVLGGTSAGAAIMSDLMITGNGNWNVLKRDSVEIVAGFGFVQGMIIDQHFFRRSRINRLLAACLQRRTMGVGIDEATAIWVKPNNEIEALGESVVLQLDCREAKSAPGATDALLTGQDIKLHIYRSGDVF